MYEVVLGREAARTLERLTPAMRARMIKALERARVNPLRAKRLRGELEGLLSLRVGEMRIVYEVDPDEMAMVVHAIGPRGDVYKR
ncbi:MAG: type II toxin-antitoxin system RelE/ParE family toxin [Anaerolineae bacterium]|nr:type II toxin-antitoxin system RelE/ParE family toxin [Anaerolineae bacterium]